MALSDHLRELRARILKVALTLVVALVVALFFFDQLFDFVYGPYQDAQESLPEGQSFATTSGAGGGLMLYLKLCGFVTLPKGLEVLIGLNPEGITNLVDFNDYLQFFFRTLLVFGVAFEIPVFVI